MKNYLAYFALLGLCKFVSCLPSFLIRSTGSLLGRILYLLFPYRRNVILENLRLAYHHEKEEKEIRSLGRKNFVHYVFLAAEFSLLSSLSKEDFLKRIEVKNIHFWEEVISKKRGIIFLTCHLGNFEWMAAGAGSKGYPLYTLARPFANPLVNRWVSAHRKKWGIQEIHPKNAKWKLFELLKQNQMVGFMIDQRKSPPDGIFVNFFGRPAGTTKGLAYLVERTDAVVLPVYNYRVSFGRFIIHFEEPISYKRVGSRLENIYHNTQVYTAIAERMIRKHPEQWFWIHRRWKGSLSEPVVG